MTCDEYQARVLAGEGSSQLDAHVAGCSRCRAEIRGLGRLRSILGDPTVWEVPSAELEHRVIAEVLRQQTPAPSPPRWAGWVAAAAVAAVAVAVGVSLRSGPDWQVRLVSTDNAPSAQAFVEGWQTDRGTRMRFEIEGLTPAGDDAYYEIWLTAADGRHVSGGTFSGSGVVETSIGVARRDFPRVWITLEPTDDDLGPSSVVVFDDPDF
jgi:anti-sigma factor RsiW